MIGDSELTLWEGCSLVFHHGYGIFILKFLSDIKEIVIKAHKQLKVSSREEQNQSFQDNTHFQARWDGFLTALMDNRSAA